MNCWISLIITGKSTTLSRNVRSPRKTPLPPILPLPLAVLEQETCTLHRSSSKLLRLALRHLSPLLLLLPLLQQQVLLKEESEGGAVDAVVAGQGRHHSERHWGSHVTVRDCPPQRLGTPGRFPRSGGLCGRKPTFFSCSTPSLAASTRCALWWRALASSKATVVRT